MGFYMEEKFLNLSGLTFYDRNIKKWTQNQIQPADWNESDPTSKSFVQNRPFYEEVEVVSTYTKNIKTGYSVNSILDVLINGNSEGLVQASIDLSTAKKYNVTLDGITYSNLEAYTIYPQYAVGVGNSAMVPFGKLSAKNQDLPFALISLIGRANLWYLICETPGEHTFSIESVLETEARPSKYVYSGQAPEAINPSSTYELVYNGTSLGTSPVMQTDIMGYTVYILGDPDALLGAFSAMGIPVSDSVENLSNIENYALGYIVEQGGVFITFEETSEDDPISFTFSVTNLFEIENTAEKYFDGTPSSEVDEDEGTETLSESAAWIYIMNLSAPFNPDFPSLHSYKDDTAVLSLGDYSIESEIELLDENSSNLTYGVNLDKDKIEDDPNHAVKQGYLALMDVKFLGIDEGELESRMTYLYVLPEIFSTEVQTFSMEIKGIVVHQLDKKYRETSWSDIQDKPHLTDEDIEYVFKNYTSIYELSDYFDRVCIKIKDDVDIPSDLTVPLRLGDVEITGLNGYFAQNRDIESVKIEPSLDSIPNRAFYGCSKLSNVDLGPSTEMTEISAEAFKNCVSLQNIVIPSSVTTLDSEVFYGCEALSSITLPESLNSIQNNAFYNCFSLENIDIPDAVTYIGIDAFYGSSIRSITLSGSLTNLSEYSLRGCKLLKTVIVNSPIEYIGRYALSGCDVLNSVVLPASVTSIESRAFYRNSNTPMEIQYGGTQSQWNGIQKASDWKSSITSITVHCSDGDITV